MSTTLLMGRTPQAASRLASQSGDGPTVTSSTASAYRPHPASPSDTFTGAWPGGIVAPEPGAGDKSSS
jgi:hypothetical protein